MSNEADMPDEERFPKEIWVSDDHLEYPRLWEKQPDLDAVRDGIAEVKYLRADLVCSTCKEKSDSFTNQTERIKKNDKSSHDAKDEALRVAVEALNIADDLIYQEYNGHNGLVGAAKGWDIRYRGAITQIEAVLNERK